MTKPAVPIEVTYPEQQGMTLHRFSQVVEFVCSRCKRPKKAKLVAITGEGWEQPVCNSCYGNVLSQG